MVLQMLVLILKAFTKDTEKTTYKNVYSCSKVYLMSRLFTWFIKTQNFTVPYSQS